MVAKKGVMLIALGSELYGQNAINLAMSLKAEDPKTEIALFYTKGAISTLKKWHGQFIDHFYLVPEEAYMVNGKPQYQRAKLLAYHFSPFEFTLYLDVDALWCPRRKVRWLMSELEDYDFTIGTGGYYDIKNAQLIKNIYTFWGEWTKIIAYHNLTTGKLWQTWSAVMSFKKTPQIEAMFKYALEVYDDPNAPCIGWAGGKPDEYCFNIGLHKAGIDPHQTGFTPVYNTFIGGVRNEEEIKENFWAFGMTGHHVRDNDAATYNNWVDRLCVKMKIPDRFYHIDKRDMLEERKTA